MLVPMMHGLFATIIHILLEHGKTCIVCVFGAVKLAKLFNAWTTIPSLRYAHVHQIIKSSSWKGLSVIDLSTSQSKNSQDHEHEANSAPLNDGSIRIPIIDAVLLFQTINTNKTFMLKK